MTHLLTQEQILDLKDDRELEMQWEAEWEARNYEQELLIEE